MGETLLFIPGLMQDARAFLPQIVGLGLDHSAQILIPDAEYVEDSAARALIHAPAKFTLVGHGLGGNVALDILRRAPERVQRIVLIATDPLAEPLPTSTERDRRMVAARAGRLTDALRTDVPDSTLWQGPELGDLRALMNDMGQGLGLEVYLRQCRALQRRRDQQKTLRQATVPALILMGVHDTIVGLRRAEFTRDLMAKAVLLPVEGAGHMPMLEQPEAVTDAIRAFLTDPLILRPNG